MKIILNMRMFAGHSITVNKDSGISTAYAANSQNTQISSNVEENTLVHVRITPKSGYYADYVIPTAGIAEEKVGRSGGNFKMPNANVTLFVGSIKNNLYAVTEDVMLCVNDERLYLKKNTKLVLSKSGNVCDMDYESGGPTEISSGMSAAIEGLVASGVLINLKSDRLAWSKYTG